MGRDTLTGNNGGFVFATLRGDVVSRASASWTTHLSYAVEEVENRSLKDFVHADDWPEVKRFLERRADTGEAKTEIWYRIRHKDGGWRHFVSTLVPSEQGIGKPATLLFVSRDVTEQKSLEVRLAQKEALLRNVLDFVPALIIAKNREGRYLLVNKRAAAYFGRTDASSIVGRLAQEISPNKDKIAIFLAYDREILESGKVKHLPEMSLKDSAGKIWTAEGLMTPIVINGERAVMSVAWDTTERNELKNKMSELRENLHHADRMWRGGELAMALAHEINQPLAGIMSNAQAAQLLLAQKEPDLAEIADILADIVADDKRAGDVIGGLRTYLKKKPPLCAELNVNEAVKETLRLLQSDSVLKDVTVVMELAAKLPKICADRIQVQQIVLNLIINAEEALAAQPLEKRRITVKTANGGGEAVMVSVRDTGPGFDSDSLARAFEPHFTTKPKGMGMGLVICRSIAEAHGGRIWAVNNPEGGATVSFSLPVPKKGGPGVEAFATQQGRLVRGGVP